MDSSIEEKGLSNSEQRVLNPWKSGESFHYKLETGATTQSQTDPFDAFFERAKEFDSSMCTRWEQDIDSLLTYAGLFSAVVTTFAVDSVNSLQQDPQEESVRLLAILAAGQTNAEPQEEFTPSTAAVTINVMYYLSLTLSLTSALVGILCKQWVREYQRDYPHLTAQQKLAVRQSRYDGLQTWHVPGIIAFIPLLLEAATALFFFGFVTMLWETNHTVAIVIIIAVIISLLFVVITTLLAPILLLITWARKISFESQCPYKTPLGWNIIRMVTPSFLLRHRFVSHEKTPKERRRDVGSIKTLIRTLNWSMYDLKFVDGKLYEGSMGAAMVWMYPFQDSMTYSECLRAFKTRISRAVMEKLIPLLKAARELQMKKSKEKSVEKNMEEGPSEVPPILPADVLEGFIAYGANEPNEEVKKDVIDIACVLFRRNVPRNEKIRYCLEGCVRIINTARELPPGTSVVVQYLLQTHKGLLDRELGEQLDASFDAAVARKAIPRPEYDRIRAALRSVYPDASNIDALLTYAGLFSAVVTTFAAGAINSLQQDPQEEMVRLLAVIAGQASAEPQEEFKASAASIRINVMYHLSLTLSLTSALIGLLCKQWLREYQRDYPYGNLKQKLAIRQSRYEGLWKWHVPGIIGSFIPLLLEVATAFFFFGFITMLWETNHTVAIVIIVAVIISLLFVVITTFLAPIFLLITWARKKPFMIQCPYKIPYSWIIIRFVTHFFLLWHRFASHGKTPRERRESVRSIKALLQSQYWWDLKFIDGESYERTMSAAMAWMYLFQDNVKYSRCLRALKTRISRAVMEELIPHLKVTREPGVEEGPSEGPSILPADVLEDFINYDTNEPDEEVNKDMIDIVCVLFRWNVPRNKEIRYCLEGCVRIINTARVLPRRTLDVVQYLLQAHEGLLDRELGEQLDASFDVAVDRKISRPEYDRMRAALRSVYPDAVGGGR
ncbi:hypothetical protein Moror_10639 [Moniliophthora roreri MCA 2997]|uniref:DUF6535 domain-containing protein n=1 Tax=Moniliophthora roreri (strain MCA 2997) TaxID=1381753 RepID=V2YJ54_MONRO|nr:hypothetical protein Moror_10639 [Moniliophthora roreri MCA 2997]